MSASNKVDISAAFDMFIADKICAAISRGCGSIETLIDVSVRNDAAKQAGK